LYTQFKEKSFIAGLGTNGSSTLPCERCFAIQAVQKHGIIPYGSKTLEQAGFECASF
jgi:hypothetical protein